jgi:hypothetical protein
MPMKLILKFTLCYGTSLMNQDEANPATLGRSIIDWADILSAALSS